MTIDFFEPLQRGWLHARQTLFHPFEFERWITVGFSSFLAGLGDALFGGGAGPRGNLDFDGVRSLTDRVDLYVDHFRSGPWIALGLFIVIVVSAVLVLLLWVGSRGKFIFLDNVIQTRAAIIEPWNRFRRLGDSLFLWRLGFVAGWLIFSGILLLPAWILRPWSSDAQWGLPVALWIVGSLVLAIPLFVVGAYIELLLRSFVIPIMYRDNLTTMAAWGRFLTLFRVQWTAFVLYGLFVVLGSLLLFVALVALSLGTCCIVPLLLSVPFLNSVVLLPLTITLRAFSVEFLAQFGDEFKLTGTGARPATPDSLRTPG